MPLRPLDILPGIFTDATDKDSRPRWKDGLNVRFRKVYPEKIGGSTKETNTFRGICRGILNWVSLDSEKFIALGTHNSLQLWLGGEFSNITPYRDSTSAPFSSTVLSNPFNSAAASSIITVDHTNHGQEAGSFVNFSNTTASPIDGILIDGEYEVLTVPGVNSFTIEGGTTATNTETAWGDASVDYDYEINPGLEDDGSAFGWGASTWGAGTWGTARSSGGIDAFARLWSLDHWGEDLVANIRGGTIYYWDTSAGLPQRAAVIDAAAPTEVNYVLVSPEDRHLIAFGSNDIDTSDFDPLLVRWCDSEDFTDWTPAATNTSGFKRLDSGSEIKGAVRTRGQILILTDSDAYVMFPTRDDFVFGFTHQGGSCGMIAQHAFAEKNGVVYYMGEDNFFMFDGTVQVMECDIWNHVFEDINKSQTSKFHAGVNAKFKEIWFFYCSSGSDEIDSLAIYHYVDKWWSIGNFERTAWAEDDESFSNPYSPNASEELFQHEASTDDGGTAITSNVESYDINIEEGNLIMRTRKLIPDFKKLVGTVDITLTSKRYAQQATSDTNGPHTINSSTEYINAKIKGRQVSLKIESDAIGDDWRAGAFEVEAYPHGRR